MKQRKNKRNLLIVSVLLLALCFVTGCGLFKSDTEQLKDLLEDKYGEKFEIESYYYDGDMWAMCYPVSDPTLLFEVRANDKVTFIGHDYYLQAVVERQVNEELQPLVEQAFPGSFVSSRLSASDYEGQTADKVSLESMMQYNNSSRYDDDPTWTHIVLNIFIDTTQLSDNNIEAEYAFLRDEIGDKIANGELPDTSIDLYFGDTAFVQECKCIIAEMTWNGNSDIYDMIETCPKSWMGYRENGEVCFTLDEYIEMRTETLSNE